MLFPAPAGVIPGKLTFPVVLKAVPRTRGGDPTHIIRIRVLMHCSPHPRG